MRILGLTGGIAMGKSTAAAAFRRLRVPVFDADLAVHRLQARGGSAVSAIAQAFPGTVQHGMIDRSLLRAAAFASPQALRRLESIMHPLVRAARSRFLSSQRRAGARLVVLDLPLLFETGSERGIDAIAVVSAPASVQRARLRRRRNLTESEIAAMLARQMQDAERRRRADVVIRTGLSRHFAQRQVRRLIAHFR